MTKGFFLTFEGPEGAGKSSIIQALLAPLTALHPAGLLLTREPGGKQNELAEAIRGLLTTPREPAMDPWTEALLFAAARREHIVQTIQPALAAGQLVLSDRFLDSSLAYQGGGRRLGLKAVADMNAYATQGLRPDLTIYLDLPVTQGLERIFTGRKEKVDRLDQESLAFHERVRQTYLTLAAAEPDRIHTVDASQPFQTVLAEVTAIVTRALEEKNEVN
ncbi:dTMP kinase [Leuconostocaceae bacterium ESL0958]|nr:dTMP kinase [Leuconostocaceae bacterium ESL0958]